VVDLDMSIQENLRSLAKAKKRDVGDLVVCMLERERHEQMLAHCREAGARCMLLPDGDVAGVIAASMPDGGIDLFVGSGGAPEGVLAAAALRCIGGQMQGRLLYEDESQVERARAMGIADPKRKYAVDEMARGDVVFAATGVTAGALLKGVRRFGHGAFTHSMVMRSKSGTVRYVEAHHNFDTKTWQPE
jgi:fructose-1,6-bisphosphatase II / sedoheptulose-1,7-bisphosphatase